MIELAAMLHNLAIQLLIREAIFPNSVSISLSRSYKWRVILRLLGSGFWNSSFSRNAFSKNVLEGRTTGIVHSDSPSSSGKYVLMIELIFRSSNGSSIERQLIAILTLEGTYGELSEDTEG